VISFLYFQLDAWLYDWYQEDFSNINLFWVNAIQTECKLSANVLNKSFYCLVNVTGFIQHLEFLKKSWNLPSNFPDLEKVWKIEIKSRKSGKKSWVFFFKATTRALPKNIFHFVKSFWILPYICSAWKHSATKQALFPHFFKVCFDHLFDNLESV